MGPTCAQRSRVAWEVGAAQAAGASARQIAESLVRRADDAGGTDNASCVVLLLGTAARRAPTRRRLPPRPRREAVRRSERPVRRHPS